MFSDLTFARGIDLKTYKPIGEGTVFSNPLQRIVALYSFDKMVAGAQWSVLWYRDGKLIYYETNPWTDTTGGYGYVERDASPDQWQPGNYEIQIFIGTDWKTVGDFVVEGAVNTSTPTHPPTATITATLTRMPWPTATLTRPPIPTLTVTPSWTAVPTATLAPTITHPPTDTPWPSQTPKP